MKLRSILVPLQTAALLLIAGFFQLAVAQTPCATCGGFPDKDANSGRFVTVTVHEQTLGDVLPGQKVIGVELQVSSAIAVGTTFQLGLFDGDVGGFWDTFTPPTADVLDYLVFADGGQTHPETGTDLLRAANGNVQVTSQFANMDNKWVLFNITQNAAAQGAGGNFFYHFIARWETTNNPNEQNLFKISVNGLPFLPAGSTVGLLGTDNSVNGTAIPIPGTPNYDGSFTFLFQLPNAATEIRLWDGDADYDLDTDDPNTGPCLQKVSTDPVCPDIPFLVSGAAQPEGAHPGNPAFPGVMYTVTGPIGTVTNSNPSGASEIELYRIGLTGNATADVTVPAIPAGVYSWNWKSVGVFNNIFIHADFDIFTCAGAPAPCPPPPPPPPMMMCKTMTACDWKCKDWPVQTITIGGKTYTRSQAIAIMNGGSSSSGQAWTTNPPPPDNQCPSSNKSSLAGIVSRSTGGTGNGYDYNHDNNDDDNCDTSKFKDQGRALFSELVAAKLNILGGAKSSCISTTITAADNFLKSHAPGSNLNFYDSASAYILAGILRSFNNNDDSPCSTKLCPKPCDDSRSTANGTSNDCNPNPCDGRGTANGTNDCKPRW